MFYPADSLKRGGRFHLCWIADSWPLRFATVTHRQLWSLDIRKLCDDLLKVMGDESGRPTKRFSLRLSSQLMRGLARIYQKKVTILLGDLCMINANVMKHSHKKWNVHEVVELQDEEQPQLQQLPQIVVQDVEELENERRLEELIVNSGNVVSNIQQITLREAAIPEFQLPPNDGFGEENQEQQLQLLAQDRTLEVMLHPHTHSHAHIDTSAQHSALDLTDKSHDKSRIVQDAQMEQISELDATMMRKSTGAELLPVAEFEKDIPEIPEILPPELPAPEIQLREQHEEPIPGPSKQPIIETSKQPEPEDIELEELEDVRPPQSRRRRQKTKLIIDKKIKLSANTLRSRIGNTEIELRCETSSDDIVDIRIPPYIYFARPNHGGTKVRNTIASALSRLFLRNLGVMNVKSLPEREIEQAVMQPNTRTFERSMLGRIEEVEEQEIPQILVQEAPEIPTELDISKGLNVSEIQRPSVVEEDIADLLTQKVLTLSQDAAQKRKSVQDSTIKPKKPRHMGTCRMSQRLAAEAIEMTEAEKENVPYDHNVQDRENIPFNQNITENMQIDYNIQGTEKIVEESMTVDQNIQVTERSVTAMLQEAGLADIQPYIEKPSEIEGTSIVNKTVRRPGSESSETPLGSLDRTRVSLGESEQTTDSRRFIRDQWGTEGSMIKILNHIRQSENLNYENPLTVEKLIENGPVISGYRRMIAARCFNSILKLKHHGFVGIVKDPETLEIRDIFLGPKFGFIQATPV